MFHDWWLAHRLEIFIEAFVVGAGIAALAVYLWVVIVRKILKKWRQ